MSRDSAFTEEVGEKLALFLSNELRKRHCIFDERGPRRSRLIDSVLPLRRAVNFDDREDVVGLRRNTWFPGSAWKPARIEAPPRLSLAKARRAARPCRARLKLRSTLPGAKPGWANSAPLRISVNQRRLAFLLLLALRVLRVRKKI